MIGVLIMIGIAGISLIGLQMYCEYKQMFEEPEVQPKVKKAPAKRARKAAKPAVKVSIKRSSKK